MLCRTIWNFQKPAWNVGEFYFGSLVGTLNNAYGNIGTTYTVHLPL